MRGPSTRDKIPRMEPVIGINLPGSADPALLRARLAAFGTDGFDAVEVGIDACPLIIDGELCVPWIEYLKNLLAEFPLRRSAHIGRGLDLRDTANMKKHIAVLRGSVDICRDLGMSPLVLHYEVRSRDRAVEDAFLQAHREAADYAGERGVLLCVENIEVELVEPVVELVDRVGSPALRMAFDTGHAFLASKYFHFDFMEAFRTSLPYLAHLHLSDNTGVFEELRITNRPVYDSLPLGWRTEYGRGDIHLPPYFGKIPYDDLFSQLRGFQGMYICEYYSERFLPFNGDVQRRVRERVKRFES